MWLCLFLIYQFIGSPITSAQNTIFNNINSLNTEYFEQYQCPQYWIQFQQSCYRFIKSPLRSYNEARQICQTYLPEQQGGVDLLSIDTLEEHGFIINQLNWQDPQHRQWYTGAHQQSANYWQNPDGSQLNNMENAFSYDIDSYGRDYLAYNFSTKLMKWVLHPVKADEQLLFICEGNIQLLQKLVSDDRTYTYGIEIDDPERIPRGPYFIKQPHDVTVDSFKQRIYNDVSLSCLAAGYPTPTYEWFKESYENDKLVAHKIDPLSDNSGKYTISGGTLYVLHESHEKSDPATYHCKASNKFGTIISESAELNFGFILEFVLRRSQESGDQNWGKAIYCDPPNHYPSVKYSWSLNRWPNFIDEKRAFVSYDGNLYFSSLDIIDRGNYSCSVMTEVSDTGKNGPFFPLRVNPHSNYQQLMFPNNFPKAFPEAPIAGKEVRLECVAFGYSIKSYNWTRKGGNLPKNSYLSNFNRVVIIPNVQVEDQGEYVCRASTDRSSIENSLILDIQAEPNFTIPLTDKHVDSEGEFVWTCEAFGIPDVNYTWWKNGRQLVMGYLEPEDVGRIKIQDNILTIHRVDEERDPGMYQCKASNTLKAKYSSAQLRVLAFAPSFKKYPLEKELYAAEQGNITIKCNPEAAPKPEFTWKKDGLTIGSGGHRRIFKNGNLIISPVSRDDEGNYACLASNKLGMDESVGRLIVLRPPRFIEPLRQRIVEAVNNSIFFSCAAETEEILDVAYIWKHNGIRIRDKDALNSNGHLYMEGGNLRIINTTFTDAGDYECMVKSAVGEISSKSYIIIEGPPGPPGGLEVVEIKKTSATLRWIDGATHGRQIIYYSVSGRTIWNSTWVNLTYGVHGEKYDRYSERKQATIENVLMPWSTYEFRVSAWNDLGMGPPSAPSPRHSTPPDKPYIAPRNVGGGGGKIGDLTITWKPLRSEEQNGPGIFYRVFWKKLGDAEYQKLEVKNSQSEGRAVVNINSDNYYSQYVVQVQAINEIGEGPRSNEAIIYSAEDMPQVAPQLVVAVPYNSTALKVSWQPIDQTREKIKGKLIGHRIKYWKKDYKEEDSVYYLSRSTRPWALIVGLQPDTYYFVKAMAYNSAGEGPESERYLERTYRKAPQKPPFSVETNGIDPSTLRVVWRYVQPSPEEEPLQGFKVRVWEIDQDISKANDTIIPIGKELEARIKNLSPGKTYQLRVLAYSNGGDGRMSSPPQKFQMGDFENKSMSVSCDFTCMSLVAFINILYVLFFDYGTK